MIYKNRQLYCPVCNMQVNENNITCKFQEMDFFFCSTQCQERFNANPHLYIGKQGISSAKQCGIKIIKQRKLKMREPVPVDIEKIILNQLNNMMGIKKITIDEEIITIHYDLLEVTEKQIEEKIQQMGEHLDMNWIQMLKLAFVHYIEETELENLEHDSFSDNHHHH